MPISKQLTILQVAILAALPGPGTPDHREYVSAVGLKWNPEDPNIAQASLAQVRSALGRLRHLGLVDAVPGHGVLSYCRTR